MTSVLTNTSVGNRDQFTASWLSLLPIQVKELEEEHSSWLDQQLEEAKSGGYKHVIVFQHIPWFLRHPDEEKEYFNIVMDLRQKMLEKFHHAGGCLAVP